MVSQLFPLPLLISVVISVVTGQDRMPTMDHTLDLMSYTCGEVTQAKQFNFVSPGQWRVNGKGGARDELNSHANMLQVFQSV